MGAGGVGGYLGAKLAAAGRDVSLIARGAHLEAIQRQGLCLRGAETIDLGRVKATDDPAAVGVVDAVLFCVKLHDTAQAARAIVPMIGEQTMVLTLQNGIESVTRVGKVVGAHAMLAGAAFFPASITAPGEVTYYGKIKSHPHIAFGEPNAGTSARVQRLCEVFGAAGIGAECAADTDAMIWQKFLLVVGNSAATGVTRATAGVVRRDPDMRALLRAAIAEAEQVGRAAGVSFAPGVTDEVLAALDLIPADSKSSQLVDLENGRRLELEGLSGAIVRLGRKLGVPTPVHQTVYAALKPFRDGPPVPSSDTV